MRFHLSFQGEALYKHDFPSLFFNTSDELFWETVPPLFPPSRSREEHFWCWWNTWKWSKPLYTWRYIIRQTNVNSSRIIWMCPKIVGFPPQIIHLLIGFSIIFTIHPFWWFSPYFWKHPYRYESMYLEPKWPLFLKVNPLKEGLFQSKQGSFGF